MKRSTVLSALTPLIPFALGLLALPLAFVGCSPDSSSSGLGPVNVSGAGAGIGPVGGATAGAATGASGAGMGAAGTTPRAGATATGAGGVTAGAAGAAAGTNGAAGSAPVAGGGAGAPQAGMPGTAGGPPTAGSGPGVGGLEPIIPAVSGECPMIKSGTSTVTVSGLRATVIAGEKKDKTGSLLIYYYGTGKLGDVNSLPAAVRMDVTAQGGIVFALNEAKNTGGDCSGTGTFGIDDFAVVDQFVACAVKDYGIDPKRIYATGCSAGGLTTGCMGIMRSNYIAAVAPNSGGITIGYGKLQNPMHAPNAITMNGGSGDNVIVNFGETSEGYDNYILKYGGFAVNCIHSSGHCGAPAALYQSAWQFLKDHPFGTKPSPYANGLPMGFHSSCKVFTMTDRAPLGGF
ncbi:MAG TPA: hypothetical protein VFG30_21855 [Polyangiales bacterium]|nr:hypothetical protein [Polyangiales bacterium]